MYMIILFQWNYQSQFKLCSNCMVKYLHLIQLFILYFLFFFGINNKVTEKLFCSQTTHIKLEKKFNSLNYFHRRYLDWNEFFRLQILAIYLIYTLVMLYSRKKNIQKWNKRKNHISQVSFLSESFPRSKLHFKIYFSTLHLCIKSNILNHYYCQKLFYVCELNLLKLNLPKVKQFIRLKLTECLSFITFSTFIRLKKIWHSTKEIGTRDVYKKFNSHCILFYSWKIEN